MQLLELPKWMVARVGISLAYKEVLIGQRMSKTTNTNLSKVVLLRTKWPWSSKLKPSGLRNSWETNRLNIHHVRTEGFKGDLCVVLATVKVERFILIHYARFWDFLDSLREEKQKQGERREINSKGVCWL